MKKIYQIFVQDIWNNNHLIGFFKNLDDAIPGINEFIEDGKWHLHPGDLKEYPGTVSPVVDVMLTDILESRGEDCEELFDTDEASLMIRGFILEVEDTLDELIE